MSQLQIVATLALVVLSLFALPVNAQLPPEGLDIEQIALQGDLQTPLIESGLPPTLTPRLGPLQPSQPITKSQVSKIEEIIVEDSGRVRVITYSPLGEFHLSLNNDANLPSHQRMYDMIFYALTNNKELNFHYDSNYEIRSISFYYQPQ